MKRLILLIVSVVVACFSAFSHDFMFKHLEVKDGMPSNQINAIYKDSRGFMWFGTAAGLARMTDIVSRYSGALTMVLRLYLTTILRR